MLGSLRHIFSFSFSTSLQKLRSIISSLDRLWVVPPRKPWIYIHTYEAHTEEQQRSQQKDAKRRPGALVRGEEEEGETLQTIRSFFFTPSGRRQKQEPDSRSCADACLSLTLSSTHLIPYRPAGCWLLRRYDNRARENVSILNRRSTVCGEGEKRGRGERERKRECVYERVELCDILADSIPVAYPGSVKVCRVHDVYDVYHV